ncbi:hypothetical protein NDU88_003178 [Pleurodeles waltl]|uniref:Uncharacterized protein n=1 Tax=Pleurodeles waltl TaxID=8319 RepID=A0AAV7UBE7_PLEWA|nr:hypothetical protein NDU88_003178 [Pleurodeles waltl]
MGGLSSFLSTMPRRPQAQARSPLGVAAHGYSGRRGAHSGAAVSLRRSPGPQGRSLLPLTSHGVASPYPASSEHVRGSCPACHGHTPSHSRLVSGFLVKWSRSRPTRPSTAPGRSERVRTSVPISGHRCSVSLQSRSIQADAGPGPGPLLHLSPRLRPRGQPQAQELADSVRDA